MKQVCAAFVKAQKQFAPAIKSKTNPHFKNKYADLKACIEAVIDALHNEGIALMQSCHESDRGVTIETLFVHESGETLSGGKLHMPANKQDPQQYASAMTYARRYALQSAAGFATEDDDGNAASGRGAGQKDAKDGAGNVQHIPQPEGKMSEEDIQKHIADMSKATTASALEAAAHAAMEAATDVKDREAYKRFRSCAADLRAALEQAA